MYGNFWMPLGCNIRVYRQSGFSLSQPYVMLTVFNCQEVNIPTEKGKHKDMKNELMNE